MLLVFMLFCLSEEWTHENRIIFMYMVGHKQPPCYPPHHVPPSLPPLYYVCVFMWGWITSIIGVEHRSQKHISAERTVYYIPQREAQLCRNRYGKPSWYKTETSELNNKARGVRVVVVVLGGWWLGKRSETMIRDHITKDSHETSSRKADLVSMPREIIVFPDAEVSLIITIVLVQ